LSDSAKIHGFIVGGEGQALLFFCALALALEKK
jgi:hypothetical protein